MSDGITAIADDFDEYEWLCKHYGVPQRGSWWRDDRWFEHYMVLSARRRADKKEFERLFAVFEGRAPAFDDYFGGETWTNLLPKLREREKRALRTWTPD